MSIREKLLDKYKDIFLVKDVVDQVVYTKDFAAYPEKEYYQIKSRRGSKVVSRSKDFWDKIYCLYNQYKLSLTELGGLTGFRACQLKDLLIEHGYSLRTKKEAKFLALSRLKQTNLERYGAENPMQNKQVQDKVKQTNLKRYGAENPAQGKQARFKIKRTNLERYGAEYAIKSEQVKNKIKHTNLERYGAENPFGSEQVKDEIKKTNLERYGAENPMQNKQVQDKVKHTIKVSEFYINRKRDSEQSSLDLLKKLGYELLEPFKGNKCTEHKIKHLKCGTDFIDSISRRKLPWCPVCYPKQRFNSFLEQFYSNYLAGLNIAHKSNSRPLQREDQYPLEIDLYVPNNKIGFEINGSYWHSNQEKEKDYHSNKTKLALGQGVKLIHIWEHDNPIIIESMISASLGLSKYRYYARKLKLKRLKPVERQRFFNDNHLHGDVQAKFAFGLFTSEDELVSAISFRKHKEGIEIARFASKLHSSVVGGFSKLLKHSIKILKAEGYSKIITYADRDWTPDYKQSVYYKNGFKFIKDTGSILKYWNSNTGEVKDRRAFQKYKLKELFPEVYEEQFIADQVLSAVGIYGLLNSGNFRFELEL